LIGYLDTSALLKLLIHDEEGSDIVREVIAATDMHFTSRISHPEARAALAAAFRAGRLTGDDHTRSKVDLDRAIASLRIVELQAGLARAAGDVAERFELRAYDAVHLASALVVDGGSTVMVTWDRALASAASAAGLDVAPGEP
jgi:predicted nucleic acid-binding protein